MSSEEAGGRIFFSNAGRSLVEEDEIQLSSVGVDIGSSTSHLAFSLLKLEQRDARYVVIDREVVYESEILLTPYSDGVVEALVSSPEPSPQVPQALHNQQQHSGSGFLGRLWDSPAKRAEPPQGEDDDDDVENRGAASAGSGSWHLAHRQQGYGVGRRDALLTRHMR